MRRPEIVISLMAAPFALAMGWGTGAVIYAPASAQPVAVVAAPAQEQPVAPTAPAAAAPTPAHVKAAVRVEQPPTTKPQTSTKQKLEPADPVAPAKVAQPGTPADDEQAVQPAPDPAPADPGPSEWETYERGQAHCQAVGGTWVPGVTLPDAHCEPAAVAQTEPAPQ